MLPFVLGEPALPDPREQRVVHDLHEPDHPRQIQRRRRVREQQPGALIGDRRSKLQGHVLKSIPGRVGLLAMDLSTSSWDRSGRRP